MHAKSKLNRDTAGCLKGKPGDKDSRRQRLPEVRDDPGQGSRHQHGRIASFLRRARKGVKR